MSKEIADDWPVMPGNYVVGNPKANVSIVTISSKLTFPKDSFAICGEMRTENLGIERVILNTISNSHVRYIVVCGLESKGHSAGQTLVAIHKDGIDENNKIIGSSGAIPHIENIPKEAVIRFQKQIKKVIDLIGETDTKKILDIINSLPKEEPHEEGFYIVKELKKVERKKIKIPEKDVIISEDFCFDPIDFLVGD